VEVITEAKSKRRRKILSTIRQHGSLGIASTRELKLDSWSPGAGFIPIIFSKEKIRKTKENCKKKSFIHTKKLIYFLKMGAIPSGCNSTSTGSKIKLRVVLMIFAFLVIIFFLSFYETNNLFLLNPLMKLATIFHSLRPKDIL
jgi:hypothetical protein